MERKRVGLFTPPLEKAGLIPFSNLVEIISLFSSDISVISGNEESSVIKKNNVSHYQILFHVIGKSEFSRILKFFILQMKIGFYFFKFNKNIDLWLFSLGGEIYIVPLILARLLKKPVFCVLSSSSTQMLSHDRRHFFIKHFAQLGYSLANKLIIYSPRLITEWHLEYYQQKILIANQHFLDLDIFTVATSLPDRPLLIGYIGRLSTEKGVQQFVQALPAIINEQQNIHVFIGGDGQLKESIELSLQMENLTNHVDLLGWISHDDLPHYLNKIRLLVIPSYTEGLPYIMLEAMACGTPVLAAPVGAIPDVIRNGETGFIIDDNTPECIAENVLRALNSPDLERIAENGRHFVEKNFTFEKTVKQWRTILDRIDVRG